MKVLRRFGFALWLAIALVAGQHAAALHDLAHVSGKLSDKQDSNTSPAKCGECFACAQLMGGAAPTVATLPLVSCDVAVFALPGHGVPASVALAYRSRAPPTLL